MTDIHLRDSTVGNILSSSIGGDVSLGTVKIVTEATETAVVDHMAIADIREKVIDGIRRKLFSGSLIPSLFRQEGIEGQEVVDYSNLITAMRNARNTTQNIIPSANTQELAIPMNTSVLSHFAQAANDASKISTNQNINSHDSNSANDSSMKIAA